MVSVGKGADLDKFIHTEFIGLVKMPKHGTLTEREEGSVQLTSSLR
jgi:hypothetical protein